jgi:hypothetical protein
MSQFDLFRIAQRHRPLPVASLVSHDRRYSIDSCYGKSPITNPAAVVNIARSQKVERAETNDGGMTVAIGCRGPMKARPIAAEIGRPPLSRLAITA